jgi:hypothetical protein
MADADWAEADGTLGADQVLQAEQVRVVTASRICCIEHGVTRVVLMEIAGEIQGIPLMIPIELSLKGAKALAEALLESENQ